MTRAEIADAIVRYIASRPDSADTLEGIATWWILQQQIDTGVDEVKAVVDQLVAKGILLQRPVSRDHRLYVSNSVVLSEMLKRGES